MAINILYEDRSIIIAEKEAGLATQSADASSDDCASLIKKHLKESGQSAGKEPYLGIVHRLDQPVAGILVFAKTRQAAAELSRQTQNGLMNKHYRAVVEGVVDAPDEKELRDSLYKDSRAGRAVIADTAPAGHKLQEAVLRYRTEKILETENKTILSITLVTGRFHQIRAQLSNMGHPIAGDRKYGAVSSYPKGIALVADRLEFIHPLSGEKVEKIVDFSFSL